jgi:hypothetical protein
MRGLGHNSVVRAISDFINDTVGCTARARKDEDGLIPDITVTGIEGVSTIEVKTSEHRDGAGFRAWAAAQRVAVSAKYASQQREGPDGSVQRLFTFAVSNDGRLDDHGLALLLKLEAARRSAGTCRSTGMSDVPLESLIGRALAWADERVRTDHNKLASGRPHPCRGVMSSAPVTL